MRNGRRLGKEVDARILAAATRDAIVTSQATMRAMAAASGLPFSTLQHVLAVQRRAQSARSGLDKALPHKDRVRKPQDGSPAARVDIWHPPAP